MKKIVVIGLILSACSPAEEPVVRPEVNWTTEKSTELGRNLAIEAEIDIKLFLEMHKDWKMTKTGSGLRYFVYEEGEANGEFAKAGQIAEIEYSVELLDGTECYKTEFDEYEEMVIDRSDVERGVQEGLKKLKVGDRAKFIIPSHIGHGLLGDMQKIPPLNTLVVDIHLLGIKK